MIKQIPNYPDYYADDSGKIYSTKYGKMLEIKQYPKTHGYLYVVLFKNNKRHYLRAHRVIAETFIPNPDNLPEVNHKDENKTNNAVSNLEWCTASYNKFYGTRIERTSKAKNDPNKPYKNNKSGRKGIWETKYHTWKVTFNREYLGTFKTFEDAVKARERAEIEAKIF
jgi:hypothetical protein